MQFSSGPRVRARAPTTQTTCRSSDSIRRAISTRSRTCLVNGVLAQLLEEYPNLEWLLVHNIDTLGATIDPGVLGLAIESGACLSFEVIGRRIDDRGGGLAKVAGQVETARGAGPTAGGNGVCPALLQLADNMGSNRRAVKCFWNHP